ncbi:hypothetical protein PVK06_043103 [Gossypium arboreum]|uniref:Uncharacterized protein n=1 Tax=Gossypium arboreum TaxID=29729 RepID=A0ABR0MMJ8_GOSAR|nr:hypothetical protein PVK06_043103 [Gossypium arboreum]
MKGIVGVLRVLWVMKRSPKDLKTKLLFMDVRSFCGDPWKEKPSWHILKEGHCANHLKEMILWWTLKDNNGMVSKMGTITKSRKGWANSVSNVLKMLKVRNGHKARYRIYGMKKKVKLVGFTPREMTPRLCQRSGEMGCYEYRVGLMVCSSLSCFVVVLHTG